MPALSRRQSATSPIASNGSANSSVSSRSWSSTAAFSSITFQKTFIASFPGKEEVGEASRGVCLLSGKFDVE